MNILAIMQNQWFQSPERVREILQRNAHRHGFQQAFCRRALARSFSGRRLLAAFGEDRFREIRWENASRELGRESSSVFPADIEHVRAVLATVQPDVVLTFGGVARDAVCTVQTQHSRWQWIVGPHPAARASDVPARLSTMASDLETLIAK